jgi:DNA-binding NtrC family response regulator
MPLRNAGTPAHAEGPFHPALVLAFPRDGHHSTQSRAIPRGGVLLGRGSSIFDVPFDDPKMSTQHAEISMHHKNATVRDLASATGTRLNGQPLQDARALVEGDVLRLGDTLLVYSRSVGADEGEEKTGAEPELTGASSSIAAIRRSIEAVAPHMRTVVVTGETGTGKEIVAHQIHRRSGRPGPFVAVSCGAFTEGLLASELFGHVRGAFTGAVQDQQGLFRSARGGTLLLDDVAEIPLSLQPTLLRVLETWQVRPVGSTRDVDVDVRVIATTNRELLAMVRDGLFRSDLYARLAQWNIRLSPLRERREDIPALASALLPRCEARGRPLTPDLQEALLVHDWPMNVRWLLNVLSVAAIVTPNGPLALGGEVREAFRKDLPEGAVPPGEGLILDKVGLEGLLGRFQGRVAEMARHMGITRPKLYRLLWAEGLEPAEFRGRSTTSPSEVGSRVAH